MKLLLSFILCFNFVPVSEQNVLEYIMSIYSEIFQPSVKGKEKQKTKNKSKEKTKETAKPNMENVNPRLKTIFGILQSHNINPQSTVNDINPNIKEEIVHVLEINRNLDDVFIIDETLTQQKAIIHYQLFGQTFQILIQYSGHLAKLYFNNMMKCVKCYVQDGKAWTVFVMKHDFGDINDGKIKEKLQNDIFITLEYNDHVEDKRMRENDGKYDGYLYSRKNEFDSLFSIEIELVKLFKDKVTLPPKHRKDMIPEEKGLVSDIWNIPENGSVVSGILDTRKKNKVINLIQTWHKEMRQNTIPDIKIEAEEPNKQDTKSEKSAKGKVRKPKKADTENIEDTKIPLEIKMKGANLLAESSWFSTSNPEGQHFGVLLRSKDALTPDIVSQIRPIILNLGTLYSLPMELLNKHGVTRIYTIVEFEHPLTNLQTIPQKVSKNVDLNYFTMIFFEDIINYQRFFSAFHLKHMIIQVIGEIEKEKKNEEPPKEEKIPEIIELPSQDEKLKIKKNNKSKSKKKSKKENQEDDAEPNTKSIYGSKEYLAETNKDKDIPHLGFIDLAENDQNGHVSKEEPKKAQLSENIIMSENDNVILIRICLFRIDLNRLVKLNHFHRIRETLQLSAVFDKEPLVHNNHINAALEEMETEEINYSMTVNVPQSGIIRKSEFSTIKTINSYGRDRSKRRGYLIGIDCQQSFTLEFDLHIQACLKKLCTEFYTAGLNGLNNIFVLFEDRAKMRELVVNIQNYNNDLRKSRPG